MGARGSADDGELRSLYGALLDAWNRRSAGDMAGLFAEDGNVVGFDGSPVDGRAAIEAHLGRIFADHPTAAFVGKIREVRFLTPEVAIVRAVAGMAPPGKADLNSAANAIQTVVAVRHDGRWEIALFQNTPAAFHGRPEHAEALTEELRQVLRAGRGPHDR